MSVHRSLSGSRRDEPIGVVIVDADPTQRRQIAGMIAERASDRFLAQAYASPEEARAADTRSSNIIIADLETIGGPSRLNDIGTEARSLIATSTNGSLNTVVAAMRAGASDFLAKPIGAKALIERLEAVLAAASPAIGAGARVRKRSAERATDFAGFIGRSPPMQAVFEQIRRMAPSRAPVFITGESGTGKELCAEAIHRWSAGPESSADDSRPFVAINCSAIPKDLMESEIFGHVRGAFTGASDNRIGAAELADGGTLFLDEIAELDLGLQAKLLRFLQTSTLQRIGGSETRKVDVRIVCATNRDPFAEVAAGRFRADLFYRLHVLPIHMPPLRERGDDVLAIANACLARFADEEGRRFHGFDAMAAEQLRKHPWPGNVRELANVIRRIVVLDDGDLVTSAMLPESVGQTTDRVGPAPEPAEPSRPAILPFWQQERQSIETALAAHAGNIARAAAALEISPSTIYRKRQAWPG
jgi:two-component system repressor protein LuxO